MTDVKIVGMSGLNATDQSRTWEKLVANNAECVDGYVNKFEYG